MGQGRSVRKWMCNPQGLLSLIKQFWFKLNANVRIQGLDVPEFGLIFSLCCTRESTDRLWADAKVVKDTKRAFYDEDENAAYEERVRWALEQIREIVLDPKMW